MNTRFLVSQFALEGTKQGPRLSSVTVIERPARAHLALYFTKSPRSRSAMVGVVSADGIPVDVTHNRSHFIFMLEKRLTCL